MQVQCTMSSSFDLVLRRPWHFCGVYHAREVDQTTDIPWLCTTRKHNTFLNFFIFLGNWVTISLCSYWPRVTKTTIGKWGTVGLGASNGRGLQWHRQICAKSSVIVCNDRRSLLQPLGKQKKTVGHYFPLPTVSLDWFSSSGSAAYPRIKRWANDILHISLNIYYFNFLQ
jgi:hypothetical protein